MYIFQNVQIIDLCADNMIFIPDNNFRNFIFVSELKNKLISRIFQEPRIVSAHCKIL